MGNFIGSLIFAFLTVYGGVLGGSDGNVDGTAAGIMLNIANAKCSLKFTDAFVKGILCNFFVCLAVWVLLVLKI